MAKTPLTTSRYAIAIGAAVQKVMEADDSLTLEALAKEAGLGRTHFWRIRTGKRSSPDAALRVREVLQKRDPTIDIPPPTTPVENSEHYAWCLAGATLIERDPELFRSLLEDATGNAEAAVEAAKRKAKAMDRLARKRHPGGS